MVKEKTLFLFGLFLNLFKLEVIIQFSLLKIIEDKLLDIIMITYQYKDLSGFRYELYIQREVTGYETNDPLTGLCFSFILS